MRYFRTPPWTPEKLIDKMGRLAVRLMAANAIVKEKAGIRVLSPSLESALNQLIHRDISVRTSTGPTPSVPPSPSHPPSSSSSGSGDKQAKP